MNSDNREFMRTTIGDTMVVIYTEVSGHAKETAYEKVRRLILRDAERLNLPDENIAVSSHN